MIMIDRAKLKAAARFAATDPKVPMRAGGLAVADCQWAAA